MRVDQGSGSTVSLNEIHQVPRLDALAPQVPEGGIHRLVSRVHDDDHRAAGIAVLGLAEVAVLVGRGAQDSVTSHSVA